MADTDLVMCIRRTFFNHHFPGGFTGISTDKSFFDKLLRRANVLYVPRSHCEKDPALKQIIPYILVYRPITGTILRYIRGVKGEESRLYNLYSVGIGGHIEEPELYVGALWRELEEETGLRLGNGDMQICGFVNLETEEVDKVHLGVVHIFNVDPTATIKPELTIEKPEFITIDAARNSGDKYETWSELCLQNFDKLNTSSFQLSYSPTLGG